MARRAPSNAHRPARLVATVALLAFSFTLGPAHAQDTAPAPATPTTPAAEKAAAAYQLGREAFAAKRFEEARGHFEKAYLLDPSPVLMFNLARACEEMGDAAKAIEYFQLYLDRQPDAADRPDIERRIRVMQAIVGRERPVEPAVATAPPSSAAPATTPTPATPPPGHSVLWPVGWATLGVGAATVGVGIYFGLEAQDAEDAHKAARTGREKEKLGQESEDKALVANVLYGLGGALLVTGGTLLVLDRRGQSAARPTALIVPGGAYLGLDGAF
jgi:tetratricopeptide (TPR) repeat protein